jgi:cob(I)alamin adenosyltransferase
VRLASIEGESVEEASLRYLNRLSDLLFVMARHENARQGISDIAWVRQQD